MSTKAYFINSPDAQYSDHEFAWFQSLVLKEGILGDPDSGDLGFEVTENDTPDMSVLVALGKALVEITIDDRTFKVVAESEAEEQVVISANSSGVDRVDAIIVRVDVDAVPNETKSNIVTIEVVTGSGATALTDGAIDTAVGGDGWYRLADITIPSGDTAITNSQITDVREKVAYSDAMTLDQQFITESAGASDENKIPALDPNGVLDPTFVNGFLGIAGETINGATLPVPAFEKISDNKIYACDGNDNTRYNFIGFAVSNSTNGNPIKVKTNGIVDGFTGLEEGKKYYVTDTVGTISTTPGTQEILVGIAVSETKLLIQKGKLVAKGSGSSSGSTVTITTGFKPSKIMLNSVYGRVPAFSIGEWTKNGNSCIYHSVGTGSDTNSVGGVITDKILYLPSSNGSQLYFDGYITNVTDTGFDIVVEDKNGTSYSISYTWIAEE